MATKRSFNNITKASHYNLHPSGVECRQIIRHMNFNIGSAIKYLWRCDLKDNDIDDLSKAINYIEDEIQLRKEKEALS